MAAKAMAARLHLLSARQVYAAKDGDHSDGGGLMLRANAGGASWVLRYTSPSGRRREMGLGRAERDSLALAGNALTSARGLAHEARELVRHGSDPLDARDGRREAARQVELQRKAEASRERWTLARCARDYHERVIERSRTPKHSAQWIASLENHVPPDLWHAPIASITPPMLLRALEGAAPHERARRHGDLGETLRRVRQRLDAVFEDAQFYERCESNPAAAIRRKMSESRQVSTKGKFAAIDYRHAPALLSRVRAMHGNAARCLEFAVLTASRTNEALLATWDEIDFDRAVMVVKPERMKAGEEHTVCLSDRAVDLLRAQLGQDPRYVFPSTQPGREGKPLSNMALLSVLDRLGVRDQTTVHGVCRATFSTWAHELDVARPDVIEACLAHRESDRVKAAYNRSQHYDARRALLCAWSRFLNTSNVIEFHRVA